MLRSSDRLQRLVCVEPPPELDRLVREQLQQAVVHARASSNADGGSAAQRLSAAELGALESQRPSVPLPFAERYVYALGLLAYGAQALSTVARFVWRAVSG
jgi:hypothetical protein